jgi:hypothetical protein
MICGKQLRGGTTCQLDPDHNGQHRGTGVWTCDGCGRKRHGEPAARGRDGEYADAMWFCIVCVANVNRTLRPL